MARQKYKQKPQFWWCIQYSGTNAEEMVEFCPACAFDSNTQKLTYNSIPVEPTMWILEDMGGIFSMMIDEQFNAFFSLSPA